MTECGVEPEFLVVGVGGVCSTAGVDALGDFFASVRPNTGTAFVVLSNPVDSLAERIAQRLRCRVQIPVLDIQPGMAIRRNAIHLAPARAGVVVAGDHLYSVEEEAIEPAHAFDVLLCSLANSLRDRAVGVVLPHVELSPEARGLRTIKAAGGMVLSPDGLEGDAGAPHDTGMTRDSRRLADALSRVALYSDVDDSGVRDAPDLSGASDECALVINERRELIRLTDAESRFLKPPRERTSIDVLDVVQPDLRDTVADLLARWVNEDRALLRAESTGEHSAVEVALSELDSAHLRISLRRARPSAVSLVARDSPVTPHALHDDSPRETAQDRDPSAAARRWSVESDDARAQRGEEMNLARLRDEVRSIVSLNEDLLAANAALRQTNASLHDENKRLEALQEELRVDSKRFYSLCATRDDDLYRLGELVDDLHALLVSTHVGVLLLDGDLRLRNATPRAHQAFDLLPTDIGMSVAELGTRLPDDLVRDLRVVLRTKRVIERDFRDAKGETIPLRILPRRFAGEARGVILTMLGEPRNDAKQLISRRDEFLSMLSHELRNPLGAIAMASKVLSSKHDGTNLPREVEVIESQSRQMAYLLDELLLAKRISRNEIRIERHLVDLRELVRSTVASFKASVAHERRQLSVDLGSVPVWVYADSTSLARVLLSLLRNAWKYTIVEGRVSVVMQREESHVVIRVHDNGSGIRPGMLKEIFELFVQENTTLARSDGGMGVGLSLVRTLVEQHGGQVTARSEGPGRGSEFIVTLPCVAVMETKDSAQPAHGSAGPVVEDMAGNVAERESESDYGCLDGRPLRIAIVDDNVDSCEMLGALLEAMGHEVVCANDGESGLQLIREQCPDLAIVDIGLPKLTGYEVATRVRRSGVSSTYMVALTGYGRATDRQNALESGFDEHLVKPLDTAALQGVLTRTTAEAERGDLPPFTRTVSNVA